MAPAWELKNLTEKSTRRFTSDAERQISQSSTEHRNVNVEVEQIVQNSVQEIAEEEGKRMWKRRVPMSTPLQQ